LNKNNNHSERYIEEYEIDLRELFLTLWKKKVFIIGFTLLVTIASIIYVNFRPYTPVYQGKLLVEIGEVFNKNNESSLLDHTGNLIIILNSNNFSASSPRGTNNLLEISHDSSDKILIEKNIQNAYQFILERHKEKTKFYDKYISTKKIGEVTISNQPINKPKKKLIVAVSFVTGFILSIFLVFFIDFIKSISKSHDRDNLK